MVVEYSRSTVSVWKPYFFLRYFPLPPACCGWQREYGRNQACRYVVRVLHIIILKIMEDFLHRFSSPLSTVVYPFPSQKKRIKKGVVSWRSRKMWDKFDIVLFVHGVDTKDLGKYFDDLSISFFFFFYYFNFSLYYIIL